MYRNQFPRHLVALNIGAIPYLLGRTMSVTVQVRQDELGRKNAGQCKIQIGHRRCDPFFDHVRFGRSCGNKVLYYCRYISRRLGFLRVEFSLQEPGRLRRGRRTIRLDIHSRSCRDGHLDLGARRHRSGSRFVSRRHDEWGRNDRLARRHGARVPFRLRWRSEQRAGPEPWTFGIVGGRYALTFTGGGTESVAAGSDYFLSIIIGGDWSNPLSHTPVLYSPDYTLDLDFQYFGGGNRTEVQLEMPRYLQDNATISFSLLGDAAPVPEPASYALMAMGFLSLGLLRLALKSERAASVS
jgi:hypothetical protein